MGMHLLISYGAESTRPSSAPNRTLWRLLRTSAFPLPFQVCRPQPDLFGLASLTGCRPKEIVHVTVSDI
jgi:hypothetical protein